METLHFILAFLTLGCGFLLGTTVGAAHERARWYRYMENAADWNRVWSRPRRTSRAEIKPQIRPR